MGPEVTEGPRPPTPFGQIQEAVAAADAGPTREARVGDLGVVERRHRADVDWFGVGERALAAGSPPPPAQGGRRGNADGDLAVLLEPDQGRPHRDLADEVLGPVDRVDDPPSARAG